MSNRDFKNSARTGSRARVQTTSAKPSGKSGGGGLVAGLLVGLIIGVAGVVGAVMYFNRASTPFTNMQKMERRSAVASTGPAEVLAPDAGNRLTEQQPPARESKTVSLPDAPPVNASGAAAVKVDSPKAEAKQGDAKSEQEFDFYKILPGKLDAVPGQDDASSKPASSASKRAYLQVGAFQHENEADNLKAKLALLGVEAKIQSVSVPEKGLLHRVRIGPFSRAEELERIKAQLKQNGLDSAVVKADNS